MTPGVSVTDIGTHAHPDVVSELGSGSHCTPEGGCITCGDVALPLEVQLVDAKRGLALCRDESDRTETVEIALVGPVTAGDSLLVHAGTAIAHLGREAEEVAQ